MKLLVLTTLVLLVPLVQTPGEDPDLVVVKFSWSKFRENSDLIHSAQDPGPSMNEPIAIKPPTPKNEPSEVKNRRDMQERRADMINGERNASQSSGRAPDRYYIRLEVKNVGPNTIKSMVWEYQPTAKAPDYDLRQYVCTMKAKPNESKTFELVSPIAPVKVVSADKKDGKVVINRIEYVDGTVWKRKGWSILIPPEMMGQIGTGKCVTF
jgi:hypothetical protein